MITRTFVADSEVLNVVHDAIVGLLDARDFLGYQLAHANGEMDDAELAELSKTYLIECKFTDEQLAERVAVLAAIINERMDADVVATAFRCRYGQAHRVLSRYLPPPAAQQDNTGKVVVMGALGAAIGASIAGPLGALVGAILSAILASCKLHKR